MREVEMLREEIAHWKNRAEAAEAALAVERDKVHALDLEVERLEKARVRDGARGGRLITSSNASGQ